MSTSTKPKIVKTIEPELQAEVEATEETAPRESQVESVVVTVE